MLGHDMRAMKTLAAIVAVAGTLGSATQAAAQDACHLTTSSRIVAVGDVHGAYDRFVGILTTASLIDENQRWIGGAAVLVQTGDVVDRGPDSRRALDLIRTLEREAEAAGGQVHLLLGNHEVMWMYGITRDASDAEYAAFRTDESDDVRERYYRRLESALRRQSAVAGQPFDADTFRDRFFDDTPLGAVEMRAAFSPDGEYGRWLLAHNTMIKINDIVFMHAGTSPEIASLGCAGINEAVRAEIKRGAPDDDALSLSPTGPLWYRDLMLQPEGTFRDSVDDILDALDARAMVIGHTTSATGRVLTRFERRIVEIDTGMLGGRFYTRGRPSALEIDRDVMTVIYEDRRERLGALPAGRDRAVAP